MDGAAGSNVVRGRDGRFRCQSCDAVVHPGVEHCLICHADLGWSSAQRPPEVAHRAVAAELAETQCPRGHGPLEHHDLGGGHVHVCARCAGLFVERGSLDPLSSDGPAAVAARELAVRLEQDRSEQVDGSRVGYLSCPACAQGMARRNFERVSGVMVDVCANHGTWFDGGEWVRATEFLAGGGLERKAKFEAQQAELDRRDRAKLQALERKIQSRERGRKL